MFLFSRILYEIEFGASTVNGGVTTQLLKIKFSVLFQFSFSQNAIVQNANNLNVSSIKANFILLWRMFIFHTMKRTSPRQFVHPIHRFGATKGEGNALDRILLTSSRQLNPVICLEITSVRGWCWRWPNIISIFRISKIIGKLLSIQKTFVIIGFCFWFYCSLRRSTIIRISKVINEWPCSGQSRSTLSILIFSFDIDKIVLVLRFCRTFFVESI